MKIYKNLPLKMKINSSINHFPQFTVLVLLAPFFSIYAQEYSEFVPKTSTVYSFNQTMKDGNTGGQERITYSNNDSFIKVEVNGTLNPPDKNKINYNYEYTIKKDNKNHEVDITSVMSPFHNKYNRANVVRTYDGTKILYPESLSVGQALPDALGTETLKILDAAILVRKISFTERRVLSTEFLNIGGKQVKATVLTGKYTFQDTSGIEEVENIKEWIVKGVGIIKQTREQNGSLISIKTITNL